MKIIKYLSECRKFIDGSQVLSNRDYINLVKHFHENNEDVIIDYYSSGKHLKFLLVVNGLTCNSCEFRDDSYMCIPCTHISYLKLQDSTVDSLEMNFTDKLKLKLCNSDMCFNYPHCDETSLCLLKLILN